MKAHASVCALVVASLASSALAQSPVPAQGAPQRTSGASPSQTPKTPVSPLVLSGTPKVDAPAVTPDASATAAPSASSDAATTSDARWVPLTVTTKAGMPVGSVSTSDLVVVQDGVRQSVTSLERWPLWLVVVLDVGRQVGPMKQLALHRQLAYDLVEAVGEDDRVAIVQYSDGLDLIQTWTRDVEEAQRAVDEKFESGLDGQLWNSVAFTTKDLLAGKLGHRAVVVITDGVDDTGEEAAYGRALGLLRESATTLYIVNLSLYLDEQIRKEAYGMNGIVNVLTSPSYKGRRRQLRDYRDKLGEAPARMVEATAETGGKLWHVDPAEDPEQLPSRIWSEIGGQMMARIVPERGNATAAENGMKSYSAFSTRSDIQVKAPTRLYAQIVSPRPANEGTRLTRSKPKTTPPAKPGETPAPAPAAKP